MSGPIVNAEDLSKWYGEVIGLNDLNLEISEGITGIVGPNGAGKSTFFKLAMGMIKPNKGDIFVMGEDPWQNKHLMEKIGFCPDYDSLSDYSDGIHFLRYVGKLHGIKGKELKKKIKRTVRRVNAEDFVEREIKEYSKGMRQRLKLAGALIHDPDLLFLDEPLSGADPKTRKDLIGVIGDLAEKRGHNVLVSSHVLSEIERMTDKIVLIYKGTVLASGEITEIRDLMDEHPHQVVIEGENKLGLAKRLLERDYVVSVGFEDNRRRLVIETQEPRDFFSEVSSMINESEIEVFEMYSRDDDLQAVFDYLVGDER